MTRVLFVCIRNGGKSQMAAGLFRRAVADDPNPTRWQVESAGTQAGTTLNGLSIESLAELGIDISDQQPRQLTPDLQQAADIVIIVGEADVEPLTGTHLRNLADRRTVTARHRRTRTDAAGPRRHQPPRRGPPPPPQHNTPLAELTPAGPAQTGRIPGVPPQLT